MENKTPQKTSLLGENLKALRKQAGINQESFSKVLGIKRSAYAYYETGKTTPKLETLEKIADAYNVKIDDIVRNEIATGDVNQEEKYKIELNGFNDSFYDLTEIEKAVVMKLRIMSREQRTKILDEIFG